ncbi:hypothetical protein [Lentilactobacillus hilgardii]|uniref:hypothetical protein n=1 Tax=Lentilactobacillus hilgardii TaxID=1588 RepID=UPI0021A378B3|nr:hypothetical protein [Lentilactobacillus hilgardii]MCT3396542.1 hypothetical protein [Lentilactobacillus hilgardii]
MPETYHRYDCIDTATSINGIPITEWGPGDFFSSTQTNNDATASNDAFGNHKMAIQHDQSGTMTFTLDPNTDAYKQILDMAGTYQEVPISVKNKAEWVHSEHAVLQKVPNISDGTGYPTRSVIFECPDYQVEPVSDDN